MVTALRLIPEFKWPNSGSNGRNRNLNMLNPVLSYENRNLKIHIPFQQTGTNILVPVLARLSSSICSLVCPFEVGWPSLRRWLTKFGCGWPSLGRLMTILGMVCDDPWQLSLCLNFLSKILVPNSYSRFWWGLLLLFFLVRGGNQSTHSLTDLDCTVRLLEFKTTSDKCTCWYHLSKETDTHTIKFILDTFS